MPGSTPPGPVGMDPADPNHPQWPYRAGLQTRRMSLELQRRQQEADALAAEAAKHLAEMHKYRSWATFYSEQQPDAEQAKLCQEWADRHQQWANEWGKASKAAYNGTYTANQTTTVGTDAEWVAVNTDDGDLLVDVPAADGRPYLYRGGLRPPLQQHQDDLIAALPRTPGGFLQMNPDPRVGTWFGLANDGGPELDPSRGINCVDCMISAWRTWRGRPQVSAPRTFDGYAGTDVNAVTGGEVGGMARVAAAVGGAWQTVFPNMSQSPATQAQQWSDWGFAAITHELQEAGHGAAMFIVTEWQAGTSHAWLAVNQDGTILFLDPQTRQIAENVSMYGHTGDPSNNANVVGMYAMMLDANGDPEPMSSLAQTSWGRPNWPSSNNSRNPTRSPAPSRFTSLVPAWTSSRLRAWRSRMGHKARNPRAHYPIRARRQRLSRRTPGSGTRVNCHRRAHRRPMRRSVHGLMSSSGWPTTPDIRRRSSSGPGGTCSSTCTMSRSGRARSSTGSGFRPTTTIPDHG
ncbi:toxin glutamine deamidase domain-containing protein [Catellatospora coxensis]